jgi:hypothetical protein
MAMKKSAQTVREELRVLNAAADDVVSNKMNEWLTPEFWATATTVVTNMVAVGVLLGWVKSAEAETLTAMLTGLVSATSVILTNGLVIWKFIASRTAVRESMIDARFRYMEAIAVEKIRAEKE